MVGVYVVLSSASKYFWVMLVSTSTVFLAISTPYHLL